MVTDQISGPDNVSIKGYGLSNFEGIQCFSQLIYTAFKGVFTNQNASYFSQIGHSFPNFELIWTEFFHKTSFFAAFTIIQEEALIALIWILDVTLLH